MSIRLRLTLWYSGLLAIVLVAFGLIIYNIVYHNTMKELREKLVQVSTRVEASGSGFTREYNLNSSAPGFDASLIGIQLVDYSGRVDGVVTGKSSNIVRSNLTFPNPDQTHARKRFVMVEVENKPNGNVPFYVYEQPIVIKGTDTVVGLLQVGSLVRSEFMLFSQLKSILWITGALGLIAAFLLGLFLSRKALMPINRVTLAAERIQSGSELSLRIPREKPNDEIGRLTDTLNAMLSGVERAYNNLEDSNTAQKRFVSDASHELRTPLTTIRGNVDLLEKIWLSEDPSRKELPDDKGNRSEESNALTEVEKRDMSLESIRDIADEARRMSGLVNDLLALARADAGYNMEMERVALGPLAEEAARRASFLPRKAEWVVGPLEALDGVEAMGNRDYLLQLLFILIENGFKYTPSGSVRLYANRTEDHVGLSVSDTGIGIRAEEVPRIFERFYRVDVSRGETSGTGLGLAIAKWIADMHRARFEVRTKLGEGTVFTLWLPIAPSHLSHEA